MIKYEKEEVEKLFSLAHEGVYEIISNDEELKEEVESQGCIIKNGRIFVNLEDLSITPSYVVEMPNICIIVHLKINEEYPYRYVLYVNFDFEYLDEFFISNSDENIPIEQRFL